MSIPIEDILEDDKKFTEFVKAMFNRVDTDGNGFVDEKGFINLLRIMANKLGTMEPTEQEARDDFKSLNTENNGKITLDEFKLFVRQNIEESG